jgi:phosphoribosylamine--glycine ligase
LEHEHQQAYGHDKEHADLVKVFHAGTRRVQDQVLTNGGRVLCVSALGANVAEAAAKAYARAEQIRFDGAFYRRDIGHRALKRGGSR